MDNKNNDVSLYEEKGLSFFDLFQIIKRRMFSIVACVIVFFGLMVFYSYSIQKPVYSTSATVMVNPTTSSGSSVNNDYIYAQRIMSTYEILFKSRKVLGEVAENIQNYQAEDGTVKHLYYSTGELYSMTSIQVLSGSVVSNVDSLIFRVSVSGYNAEDCAIIANEIVEVTQSLPGSAGDFAILKNSTLTSVDKAVPNYSYSKNLFRNGIIGIALGMVVAAGYIVIRELTDTTVSDAKSLENILELNVLAVVPDFDTMSKEKSKVTSKKQ